MTAPDRDPSERGQNFALRWQTATPQERRRLVREGQNGPQTTRRAYVLVGLLFMAGGISATVKAVDQHQSAVVIGACVVASVLCGAMAELSRRGRTRLGFSLMVVGLIAVGLAEAL